MRCVNDIDDALSKAGNVAHSGARANASAAGRACARQWAVSGLVAHVRAVLRSLKHPMDRASFEWVQNPTDAGERTQDGNFSFSTCSSVTANPSKTCASSGRVWSEPAVKLAADEVQEMAAVLTSVRVSAVDDVGLPELVHTAQQVLGLFQYVAINQRAMLLCMFVVRPDVISSPENARIQRH